MKSEILLVEKAWTVNLAPISEIVYARTSSYAKDEFCVAHRCASVKAKVSCSRRMDLDKVYRNGVFMLRSEALYRDRANVVRERILCFKTMKSDMVLHVQKEDGTFVGGKKPAEFIASEIWEQIKDLLREEDLKIVIPAYNKASR